MTHANWAMPKMLVLGFQHRLPCLALRCWCPSSRASTCLRHFCLQAWAHCCFTCLPKGKGARISRSSFAFLGGYAAVAPLGADGTPSEMLPYAAGGVVVAGFIYVVLAALIKVFGVKAYYALFPPVVTGPIIIAIGLILAPSAITNFQSNWLLAFIALAIIVVCNIWGQRNGKNFAHPHWHCGLVHCGPVDGEVNLTRSVRPIGLALRFIQAAWQSSASAPASPLPPLRWPP